MKKTLLLTVVLLVLALGIMPVYASDPEPGTAADNECNPGGTMAGKCDTDWEWQAGWYLARYNRNQLTAAQVPATYRGLLPTNAANTIKCFKDDYDPNYNFCLINDRVNMPFFGIGQSHYAIDPFACASYGGTFDYALVNGIQIWVCVK